MRHRLAPIRFSDFVKKDVFEEFMCAYTIIDDGPSIVPIVLPEQRESVEQAFKVLATGPYEGARSHLRKSAKCINEADLAGSVRESIHAVESVARIIAPQSKQTLDPALKSLEKAGLLKHPTLKSAFVKLYSYTNNEQGIRHSLLNQGSPDVGLNEAMFMFGACAAFAGYLVNIHRQAESTADDG